MWLQKVERFKKYVLDKAVHTDRQTDMVIAVCSSIYRKVGGGGGYTNNRYPNRLDKLHLLCKEYQNRNKSTKTAAFSPLVHPYK